MNKGLKKAVVFALGTGLAVTALAGCGKKEAAYDTEAAAITVGDTAVAVSVVNTGVRYEQSYLESIYKSFGIEDPFSSDLYGNGTTLGDEIKSSMVEQLTHSVLAEQHMGDYEVTLEDEEKTAIEAAAHQFMEENDENLLNTLHITEASVARYMELSLIQNKMEAKMGEGADQEVSDEEAAQRKIQYVLINPITAEDVAAEEAAAAEAETEAETAALEANDAEKTQSADETEGMEAETEAVDPEAAQANARAYDRAMQIIEAVKNGQDLEEAAQAAGQSVTDLTLGADYTVQTLVEATEGVADDTLIETPVAATSGGYYVIKVVSAFDAEATEEEKERIVEQRKTDFVHGLYEEWEEAVEVATDADVLATVEFDYFLERPEEVEAETEEATE